MKFLQALLAQLAIGLIYRLGVPTMCAMIIEHFITHPQVDDGFSRYPHAATFVITGLFSAVCAALVISTSKNEFDPMVAVTTRTCAAASVWWFVRLAIEQDQRFDAIVFYTVAFCLLAATVVSLTAIPTSARVGGYVLYGTAAAVVVLFGLFTSGRQVLTLERQAGLVSATLDTYRWLGFRRVSERKVSQVNGLVTPFQSRRFKESEGAFVIQGDEDEILVPSSYSERVVKNYLESSDSSLVLVEPTSSPWRMSLTWLIASAVLAGGLLFDPLVMPAAGKLARKTPRWIAVNFWLSVGLFVVASAGMVWHWSNLQKHAREQIELLGCTVEDADLKVRGKHLYGGAWKVMPKDRTIDDERLRQLAPHLNEAPGYLLDLSHTRVTDAGMQHLIGAGHVIMLDLRGTAITGAALPTIKRMNVWYLDVRDTAVRAADIQRARFGYLQYLLFTDPEFSPQSVGSLLGIEGLEHAYIETDKLTPADLKFWSSELDFEIEVPPRAEAEPADSN